MKIIRGIAMLLLTATFTFWGKKNLDKSPLSNSKETAAVGMTGLLKENTVIPPLETAREYGKKNEIEKYYGMNEPFLYHGGNAGN